MVIVVMIPKNIHFIWVGCPLPDKYIDNIHRWSTLNSDYEINIWIDRGSLNSEQLIILGQQLAKLRAKIRDLDSTERDLYNTMLNRDFYNDEVTGIEANYAAASDILRLAILEQEGGVYIDTDTLPIESKPLGDIDAPYGFVKPIGSTNDVLAAVPNSIFIRAFSQKIHDNYCKQLKQQLEGPANETMKLHRGIRPWKLRCETTLDWTGPDAILPILQQRFFAPLIEQNRLEEAERMCAGVLNKGMGQHFNTQSDKTWLDKGPQTLTEEQEYFKEEFNFRLRYFCVNQVSSLCMSHLANSDVFNVLEHQLIHLPEALSTHHILKLWKRNHQDFKSKEVDRLIRYTQKCEELLGSMPMLSNHTLEKMKAYLFPRERFDENTELNKSLHPQYSDIKSIYQHLQNLIASDFNLNEMADLEKKSY
jgi:hypothetical protein